MSIPETEPAFCAFYTMHECSGNLENQTSVCQLVTSLKNREPERGSNGTESNGSLTEFEELCATYLAAAEGCSAQKEVYEEIYNLIKHKELAQEYLNKFLKELKEPATEESSTTLSG